jgi:hypothetical protein
MPTNKKLILPKNTLSVPPGRDISPEMGEKKIASLYYDYKIRIKEKEWF